MVALHFIVLAAAACASASLTDEKLFASLLKRQEPGTPAYNCHDNCGQAITISKAGGDVCKNEAFVNNYNNCLQCSGPDNVNIWRYYGRSLSTVAQGCGLETTPKSGKQSDVPPAQSAGRASSTSGAEASSTSGTGSAAPTSEVSPSTSAETTETTSSEGPGSSGTVETLVETVTSATDAVVTPSASGVPTPSSNGTATFTSSGPAQQSMNAAPGLASNVGGVFGAMVMGMLYGLGN